MLPISSVFLAVVSSTRQNNQSSPEGFPERKPKLQTLAWREVDQSNTNHCWRYHLLRDLSNPSPDHVVAPLSPEVFWVSRSSSHMLHNLTNGKRW